MAKASKQQLSEFYKMYGGPRPEELDVPIEDVPVEEAPPQSADLEQPIVPAPEEVAAATGDVPTNSAEADRNPAEEAFQTGFEQGVKDQLSPAEKSSQAFQKRLESILPDVEAQRAGLKRMEEINKGSNDWRSWDLSPLLAYFDSERGTKLAQSYQSPQSKAAEKLKMESGIQGEREGVTKSMLDLYKEGRSLESEKRNDRYLTTLDDKISSKAMDDANKLNKEFLTASTGMDKLEEAYSTGNYDQMKSLAGAMSKFSGNVGATSDSDAARQLQDSIITLSTKFKRYVDAGQRIPKAETQDMVDLIRRSREFTKDVKSKMLSGIKRAFIARAKVSKRDHLTQYDSPVMKFIDEGDEILGESLTPPEKRKSYTGVLKESVKSVKKESKSEPDLKSKIAAEIERRKKK